MHLNRIMFCKAALIKIRCSEAYLRWLCMYLHLVRHRPIQAVLLICLFVTTWFTRSVHVLWVHHQAERPPCEAHDEHVLHLHDERYAVEDCLTCTCLMAVADLPPLWVLTASLHSPKASPRIIFVDACPSLWAGYDLTCRRGPPPGV